MKNKDGDIDDNQTRKLEFLVNKSRNLLKEQLIAYENCTSKSSILATVLAFLIPVSYQFVTEEGFYTSLSITAGILGVIAVIALLLVLVPKGLAHSYNFEQFARQFHNEYPEMLNYEIRANKTTYNVNEKIVSRQISNFSIGIYSIMICSIILLVNLSIGFYYKNEKLKQQETCVQKMNQMNYPDKNEMLHPSKARK